MIRFNIDRFAWTFVALAMLGLSGCKQISIRSTVTPSVSPAPRYGYEPPDDTYFHRPEMAPRLEEVPSLPAPGHSVPTDPPPPAPAPDDSAATSTGDNSVTASKIPWALRPMSFLNRKETKSDVQATTGETDQKETIPNSRPPVLATKPEGVRWAPSNREIVLPRQSVPVSSAQNNNPPSLDDSYTGPVITPGSSYAASRNAPPENWPHTNRSVAQRPAVHLRKQPEPISTDAFVPVLPPKTESLPASVQPESSPATVPLLLPPGA